MRHGKWVVGCVMGLLGWCSASAPSRGALSGGTTRGAEPLTGNPPPMARPSMVFEIMRDLLNERFAA